MVGSFAPPPPPPLPPPPTYHAPHPPHNRTGGNSGIGVETVRVLAAAGANVVLCSRSLAAGQAVAEGLAAAEGGLKGTVVAKQLDLADLSSIKALGDDLAASLPSLDLLICNAGVMVGGRGLCFAVIVMLFRHAYHLQSSLIH